MTRLALHEIVVEREVEKEGQLVEEDGAAEKGESWDE